MDASLFALKTFLYFSIVSNNLTYAFLDSFGVKPPDVYSNISQECSYNAQSISLAPRFLSFT
jgi:hypothetical protein